MQCAHCSTPVPDGARFCQSCGSQVSDADKQARVSGTMDVSALQHMEKLLKEDTAGEFEIQSMLGRGGMAVVFLAREIKLARKVAIKVLPPELTFGHGVDRFMREAQTAALLDHPSIIPIYRISSGGKLFWYAMKFLEGRSLEDLLKDKGTLGVDEVVPVLEQVADALDYAHTHNVIHRDMKPANVMLDSRNRVIVTDFGIAKALTEQTLTASGSVVGTPYYMSPEQGMGKGVSGRSDQYSVAVMAYRMLSGQFPFEGDSAIDILHKHCMTPPSPLELIRPGLPRHVYLAINKALEKKPERRFSTMAAFVEALRGPTPELEILGEVSSEGATIAVSAATGSGHLSGDTPPTPGPAALSSAGTVARAPATPPTPTPPTPTPRLSTARPKQKKKHGVLVVGGILVLGVAGVGGFLATYRGSTSDQGAPPSPPQISRESAGAGPAQGAAPPTEPPVQEAPPTGQPAAGQAAASQESSGRGVTTRATDAVRPPPPSAQLARQPERLGGTRAPQPVAREPEPPDLPSRPGMGLVVVVDAPQQHRLFVDGRRQSGSRAELAPGTYLVRVTAPDVPSFETTVNVLAGQRSVVRYGQRASVGGGDRPQPALGQPGAPPAGASQIAILRIQIRPWANVTIGGVPKGAKTNVVDTLIPGTVPLHFELDGFIPKDTMVTLRAGETKTLTIRMVPQR